MQTPIDLVSADRIAYGERVKREALRTFCIATILPNVISTLSVRKRKCFTESRELRETALRFLEMEMHMLYCLLEEWPVPKERMC